MRTKLRYDGSEDTVEYPSLRDAVDAVLKDHHEAVCFSPYSWHPEPLNELVGADDEFLWLDDPEFHTIWDSPGGFIPLEEREVYIYRDMEDFGDGYELARLSPVLPSP